jgi:Uma2 family endonuclease
MTVSMLPSRCRTDMSTTKPSLRPPTLADLETQLPPNVVGEIIEGVLCTMTKPRVRHQRTTTRIGADVSDPFDMGRGGPGGWWTVTAPGIVLPHTPEISPDVAGWRRERMRELPVDEPITMVPDRVCEIRISHDAAPRPASQAAVLRQGRRAFPVAR